MSVMTMSYDALPRGRAVTIEDLDGSWTATRPFEVTITPSTLLD